MKQDVLVLGANGMLGYTVTRYLTKFGYRVKGLTRKEFDIATDGMEKFHELAQGSEVIINCAGVIKPLIPSVPVEITNRVNSEFPKKLAKYSSQRSKLCIHITSDCVYNGLKGNYSEADPADAEDLYGRSKAGGDNEDCMTLRTSIIGEERREPFRCLLEWVRSNSGKKISGYTNHVWNGVTTTYLAEIIKNILEKNMYTKGIFHIHSPDTVTKDQLLHLINDIYELGIEIMPTQTEIKCDRSMTSKFDLSKSLSTKNLEIQIRELRGFFKSIGANEAQGF